MYVCAHYVCTHMYVRVCSVCMCACARVFGVRCACVCTCVCLHVVMFGTEASHTRDHLAAAFPPS